MIAIRGVVQPAGVSPGISEQKNGGTVYETFIGCIIGSFFDDSNDWNGQSGGNSDRA